MFARNQLIAFAFASVLCSVSAQSQLPADCSRNYTVQAEDTCNAISANENVSTFQLAFVNDGIIDATCQDLFVGEVLCLGITGQDCTDTHVVASGDFCALIAEEAAIELSVLLENNPNIDSDCTNIAIGEVLCTAEGVIPYSS